MNLPTRDPDPGAGDADGAGERDRSANALLATLYAELKSLAKSRLSSESVDPTQTTALVHETYLRLVARGDPGWDGRAHFFAAASQAMRRILVERARARSRLKRGGGAGRVALADAADASDGADASALDVIALDEALTKLARADPRKARLVELRYFAGLGVQETAALLERSPSTVKAEWDFARAWLRREMSR